MSIEASTSVDPYARTCQAAHLLGWVCEHVNQNASSEDADMHFQEAFSIAGALRALLTMLEVESNQKTREERQRLFAARGLAYAALNTLYDVHSCIEPDNVETVGGHRGLRLDLQQFAIDEFKKVILDVSAFASEIEDYCGTYDVNAIPVTVLFSLYTVAGTYAWYAKENAAEKHLFALAELRRVLKTIATKRWKVACKSSLVMQLIFACPLFSPFNRADANVCSSLPGFVARARRLPTLSKLSMIYFTFKLSAQYDMEPMEMRLFIMHHP